MIGHIYIYIRQILCKNTCICAQWSVASVEQPQVNVKYEQIILFYTSWTVYVWHFGFHALPRQSACTNVVMLRHGTLYELSLSAFDFVFFHFSAWCNTNRRNSILPNYTLEPFSSTRFDQSHLNLRSLSTFFSWVYYNKINHANWCTVHTNMY